MDDWILESQHYGYYKEGAEFSVKVEEEALLTFPYYLNIYTFERENDTKFPSPKKGSTDVLGASWCEINVRVNQSTCILSDLVLQIIISWTALRYCRY